MTTDGEVKRARQYIEQNATFVVFANKSDNDSSEADKTAFALLKVVYPDVGKK
jgi:hypothetical protein